MSNKKQVNKNSNEAIKILLSSRKVILSYLQEVVNSHDFNYRTFGTDIEDHLNNILIKLFKSSGFIKNKEDYVLAPHKNYFPDFELKTSPPIAIEFKSGNKMQNHKGKWVEVKNSENDMGTLNEWPNKINKFSGDRIYYLFVIYNFNDKTKEVLNIQLAPFYRFIGLNSDGMLKYREKDGNLRPKDFDANSPVKTLEQFDQLIKKTNIYRSKRIIKRHRLIIKKANEIPKKKLD